MRAETLHLINSYVPNEDNGAGHRVNKYSVDIRGVNKWIRYSDTFL